MYYKSLSGRKMSIYDRYVPTLEFVVRILIYLYVYAWSWYKI